MFLSKEFLANYKNKQTQMTDLGSFVYTRTYSRWLPSEQRRETWVETLERVINYNIGLELKHNPNANMDKLKEEAEELFDNMFHLKQFTSGRTMWIGGTPVSEMYPTANFNCSFLVIDGFDAFTELFYLLMIGSGVGFRTMPNDVDKLPNYRTEVVLSHRNYTPVPKDLRKEFSFLKMNGNKATIHVGDSKEGWVQSLGLYFDILTKKEYQLITDIELNYDSVRPKGEKLVRFGGKASGHTSLKRMFLKIDKIMKKANGKLIPIHALDIGNIIGENVVSGGVRRTAEINLSALEDTDIELAKTNLFKEVDGEWKIDIEIEHRTVSNNSIFFEKKPTRAQLHQSFKNMQLTGERGLINAESARKRRKDAEGLNPCAEIILANKGLCNLSTVNVLAFVKDGVLDIQGLYRAFQLSARIGLRMTLVELEMPLWNEQQKKDRLLGCSVTGWFDMVDAVHLSIKEQRILLRHLKEIVRNESNSYADELGVNHPLLATTVKPEGTISCLPTVSSGVHRSHADYYIRRVRISAFDPLAKVVQELNYPVFPENGQTWDNASTLVVEFPVHSPAKVTKHDVSAIEQLETYKMFQEEYVEHNTSITVTVREEEWDEVEEWVWNNWDSFVAVSFLSLYDSVYPLMPYEKISKGEYEERKENMKPFDASLLTKYELKEVDLDIGEEGCENGVCPIR
ncbi:ribonucleoside-triphosphate reductase, adenosylcobalamin-dependent [Bacillus sp. DX4.1]|uniref:ribonucleoside-triphosphate reductase, adenosylcobalamin-dependent n=1 Tax=Bacillus sp. DX4.1 TaxID=3055867 RepID=UPI0025A06127|nr:ribonucleoside-triphosphate reductase, adenosylcobalamin-dependent [Bacillus sp. DX4.1]MDM5190773.1 ribonucleoside-triphosphate reductase, adenosylcobalamin-dependent [Bacillus sp. DX4.1]